MTAAREPSFDAEQAERLLLEVARGNAGAFNRLVELIWPDLSRSIASSRRLAAGRATEDGPHDVGLRIIEKLQHNDFRALRLYEDWRARHPEKSVVDWLRIVAANVTRDYLRELRGQPASDDLPSPKQLLNVFSAVTSSEDLGTRPPMTWAQTARQLLEYARGRLAPEQLGALEDWLQGASFEDIASTLRLAGGAEEARRSVRASLAVLRREFSRG